MGPVPKWGLYFYWGRGITRVVFNRPLYPAHVDASDSESQELLLVSELVLSWRAFPQRMIPLSCGCSHSPFFLKEYTLNTQSLTSSRARCGPGGFRA